MYMILVIQSTGDQHGREVHSCYHNFRIRLLMIGPNIKHNPTIRQRVIVNNTRYLSIL